MARTAAAFTLVELIMTVALVAILAVPIGGLVVETVKGSALADDTLVAMNLARYEQERIAFLGFANTVSWCSVPPGNLPPSESWCPGIVNPSSPYGLGPLQVTRRVDPQTPTDGSSSAEMKRITVKVFRSGQAAPVATLTTYLANGTSFSAL